MIREDKLTRIQRRTLRLYQREGFDRKATTDSLVELSAILMVEQLAKKFQNDSLVMICVDCGTMTSLDKNTMTFFCPKCGMNKPARPQTVMQYLEAGGKI